MRENSGSYGTFAVVLLKSGFAAIWASPVLSLFSISASVELLCSTAQWLRTTVMDLASRQRVLCCISAEAMYIQTYSAAHIPTS